MSLELLGLPGWTPLPLEGPEPYVWAEREISEAARGLMPIETSIGETAAVEALSRAVHRARALWKGDYAAPMSFAFQPDPLGPVLAVMDLAAFPFEDEPLSPERMLQPLGAGSIVTDRVETSEIACALGPTVRYRGLFQGDETASPGSRQVLEGVSYAVTPPELRGFIWIQAQWPILALGDVLVEQVEQMVNRLQWEFCS